MPVDPELQHLMEEQARVNAASDEWLGTFGFRHNCHCGEDYANDNTGTVTECWARMAEDALDTCATLKGALDRIASGKVTDAQAFAQEFLGT